MSGWDLVMLRRPLAEYLRDIIEAHERVTSEPSSDWAALTYGAVAASYILEAEGVDRADPDLSVLIAWRQMASPRRLVQPYEGAERVASAARSVLARRAIAILDRAPDGPPDRGGELEEE